MDVGRMTRDQLLAHARGCERCAAGDDELLAGLIDSRTDELVFFIVTSHDPVWDPS